MRNKYYYFSQKEQESGRLQRLNEIYNPHTMSYLDKIIHTGMQILEIGPGNGTLAAWMCNQLGETGKYLALEQAEEAIGKTKKNLDANSKYRNYEIINGLVENVDEIINISQKRYDVIYCRWVLAYVNPRKLDQTLLKLFNLLKPNGRLICEEGDVAKSYCLNIRRDSIKLYHPAFNEWFQITFHIGEKFGYDFELGSKIKSILERITKQPTRVSFFQPTLKTTHQKQSVSFAIPAMANFLLEQDLMDKSNIERLAEELHELAEDNNIHVVFVANTIVDVQKPMLRSKL